MSIQKQLLAEIEEFLLSRRMAQTTFGRLAVNDGKFVARLQNGANVTVATLEKVRNFIRSSPALQPPAEPASRDAAA